MKFTGREMKDGRALLIRMVAEIRKTYDPRQRDTRMEAKSLLGGDILARVRKRNLDALVIRKVKGGWHADVLLKGLPVGVPTILGTKEDMPLPSRFDAIQAGKSILESLYHAAMDNEIAYRDSPANDKRYFDLYGRVFEVPGEVVDAIDAVSKTAGIPPDPEYSRMRLTEILTPHLQDGDLMEDPFPKLSEHDLRLFQANLVALMLCGEFRHPPIVQAEPDGEEGISP